MTASPGRPDAELARAAAGGDERAYAELVAQDVLMIVGPAIGDNALVATPLAERHRIPVVLDLGIGAEGDFVDRRHELVYEQLGQEQAGRIDAQQVRIEGSASCVRLGGSVRVDVGKSTYRGTGSAVRGMAELETRTETGLGTMRTVIRAGGTMDRNLDSGRYRY